MGYNAGDTVAMCLPNNEENLLTQLATAHSGIRLATVKTGDALAAKVAELDCKGVLVDASDAEHASKAGGNLEPIIVGAASGSLDFQFMLDGGDIDLELGVFGETDPEAPFAFYNSSKGSSQAALTAQGMSVHEELQLKPEDKLCIPVTLNHGMGMGFGVCAALAAQCPLVIPGPSPDAEATLSALQDEACTILYADSHTLKVLAPLASAGPSLRGGLLKIGSGEKFGLAPPVSYSGIELTTVGNPPAPKE
jgi:fatty-acyl-CoA synthase